MARSELRMTEGPPKGVAWGGGSGACWSLRGREGTHSTSTPPISHGTSLCQNPAGTSWKHRPLLSSPCRSASGCRAWPGAVRWGDSGGDQWNKSVEVLRTWVFLMIPSLKLFAWQPSKQTACGMGIVLCLKMGVVEGWLCTAVLHRVCDNPVVTMLFEIKAGRSFIFGGIPSSLKCRHRFYRSISSESISLKDCRDRVILLESLVSEIVFFAVQMFLVSCHLNYLFFFSCLMLFQL